MRRGKTPNGIKGDNNSTDGGSSSAPPQPPWIELPRELTENILRRLGPMEILETAQRVCTTWRSVCSEPSLWRVIHMEDEYDEIFGSPSPAIICCRAVDRSQGELIDIDIEFFCTDDLLHYISERANCLKRLSFGCCGSISSEGLIASVKKFPELEELHLLFVVNFTAENIEDIGISCPKLKSFTFNNRSNRFARVKIDDNCAFSIAKNMPNLVHLCLRGNKLSNEGLKAILNGCPNLESLDLQKCYNVDLGGDFGNICSERIKYLKCSSNSTDDYDSDDAINDLSSDSDSDDMFYDDEYYWNDSSDFQYVGDYDYDNDPFRRSI